LKWQDSRGRAPRRACTFGGGGCTERGAKIEIGGVRGRSRAPLLETREGSTRGPDMPAHSTSCAEKRRKVWKEEVVDGRWDGWKYDQAHACPTSPWRRTILTHPQGAQPHDCLTAHGYRGKISEQPIPGCIICVLLVSYMLNMEGSKSETADMVSVIRV
jgi:hypothetical protein